MENNALTHHGILGMKWGVRRYQNKDGSLTKAGKKRYDGSDDKQEETVEERRSRLLKSTDANELYKNRDVLTTQEINERLNRIDTERRLAQVANGTKKTGMDRVDNALKKARKIDEVYKFVTESAIGKTIVKSLSRKVEENLSPDLKKVWENKDKISDATLTNILKRANTEKALQKIIDENDAKAKAKADEAKAEAQKEVDAYNAKLQADQVIRNSYYSVKGKNIVENMTTIRDTKVSDVNNEILMLGQTYIAGMLPEKASGGD